MVQLLALALLCVPAPQQAEQPTWQTLPPKGGRLEEREGIRVLHLEGSVLDRGFAEGVLLADEIVDLVEDYAIGYVCQGERLLWEMGARLAATTYFEFDEEDRLWADAVVVGIQAKRGSLRLESIGRDLDGMDLLTCAAIPDLEGLLCSSLAVWGPASANGDVLVGRNLDYPASRSLREHVIVRVHAPRGEDAGWVGISWPGQAGCLTGLSDEGVFVAIHDVDPGEAAGKGKATPRVLALESLVTELRPGARTADIAARMLREHRFRMGANVLCAWSGNDAHGAVVLEIDANQEHDGGVTVRGPKPGQTYVACSNHHRSRQDDRGCSRYGVLAKGGAQGKVDPARMWELIDSSGMSITLHRCVAEIRRGRLSVQAVDADDEWREITAIDLGN